MTPPASADALAGGVISYAHARVLASAAGELPAESLPTVEPILVEAARHTDPAGLRALCTQVRTMLDPTGAEEAAALAHDRRHLSISTTFAGTVVLDGVLDPEAGATVLAALARLACDATISPVLTAGPSEVLDLGRSVRLVSPAQRRALVVRDGGCVWPGCDGHRPSPMPTTCGTGSTAAPPTWPTWRWSAGAITGWCTPAGSWPTARRNLERDAAVGGASEPHRSRRRAEPRPVRRGSRVKPRSNGRPTGRGCASVWLAGWSRPGP